MPEIAVVAPEAAKPTDRLTLAASDARGELTSAGVCGCPVGCSAWCLADE